MTTVMWTAWKTKSNKPRPEEHTMSGLIIFGLLLTLMLTGMPVSISLGLTVLTFIFGFTNVPVESVA
jgi:hypothetical protein